MATAAATSPAVAGRTRPLDLAAEVALALTTVAAVICLGRLFEGDGWMQPAVAAALTAHLVAAAVRRTTTGVVVPVATATIGAVVFAGWTRYPATTVIGLPTGSTLSAIGTDLSRAWDSFGRTVAPAPVEPGFVLACVLAAWAVAWFADTAAFRLRAPLEAVLPALGLLLFASLLGAPDRRISTTAAVAGAIVLFLLLHRVAGQIDAASWVGGQPARGAGRLIAVGVAVGVGAVLAGALTGPVLPGATSESLVDLKGARGGKGTRITVSPLVDIRRRLVQQSDLVAFTVKSDRRSYWRLTSLDRFDGQVWSSTGSYAKADDDLEPSIDERYTEPARQAFDIKSLNAIWAPVAFQPSGVQASSTGLRWDDTSATLIVDTDLNDSNDIRYEVVSEVPVISREVAEMAKGTIPQEVLETYLDLPDDFQRFIPDVRIAVGDADTPYEKALALQEYFRSHFHYNLEGVPEGHSDSAMADFLNDREGYCEQFAGTFAAFARASGIPARVAVGFTPGEQSSSDPTLYTVRGEHAHAWPEVYLAGIGWVPFEPTPGRGIPGAEDYTGVPAQQEGDDDGATTSTTAATGPSTTIRAAPLPAEQQPPRPDQLGTGAGPQAAEEEAASASWLRTPVRLLTLAALAAIAYVVILRSAVALRRSRRRATATTASSRVRLAWDDGAAAMTMLGPRPRPSETHVEFADRVARQAGQIAPRLRELADVTSVAMWSSNDVSSDDAERAGKLAAAIRASVRERLDRRAWLRAELDPRLVLGRWSEAAPAGRSSTGVLQRVRPS